MKSSNKKNKQQDHESSVKPFDALTVVNTALIAGIMMTSGKSEEKHVNEEENHCDCDLINQNMNVLNITFKSNMFDTLCKFEVMMLEIENLKRKINDLEAKLEKLEKK